MENKKINSFFACVLILIFASCIDKNEKFDGYLVGKDYTPKGMCHDCRKTITYCIVVPIVHPPPHRHQYEPEKYVWYIANKYETIQKQVTKQLFNTKKCGERIIIKRW